MASQNETPATQPQASVSQGKAQDFDNRSIQTTQSSEPYDTRKMKTYNMFYTTSKLNYTLHLGPSSSPCVYYAETTLATLSKPQILLRHGNSKSSPMVAFARNPATSRHMLLGSGDYEKGPEESLGWEELRRELNVLHRSDYTFGTAVGSSTGKRQTYKWIRDRTRVASNVFHCVSEDEDEELVAVMLSGGMFNFRKGAEIQVAEGLETGLEELFILSALSIWMLEGPHAYTQGYEDKKEGKKAAAPATVQ